LPKRLDHRRYVETIERNANGAWIECRDETLLLIGCNARNTHIIEPAEELPPVFCEARVSGGCIGYGAQEWTPLVAEAKKI
jgi:hypothetical protein